ncbi:probable phosphatidylglycerol / phosphatidylinositol transfer protein [Cephalotrichum gorgonifer]|uniref:Phosphatidylglycerol/phosphatidylinositol transfer protein n=1 Tax=Cephalotrichum gorgonifer TaxID=2041049 RepID=A0AAE8N6M7_9PEZI|nr:probable phosphatidylglycerol / phosphatidylinositol transfer protein [Cephalotrichum gorgonifer]
MRLSTAITLLSAALAPVAASISNVRRGADLKVPGDSPIEYCSPDHADDILTIESIDLSPNPPLAGEELLITAVGKTSQDIEEGAYVLLQVKYGLIRLISTTADLCEQITNVDLECPIKKGDLSITKAVALPAEIPPGKYTVSADVYSANDEPITCLQATVVFPRAGFALNFEL